MRADRNGLAHILACFFAGFLGHCFRRHTRLTKSSKDLRYVFMFHRDRERIPRPEVITQAAHMQLLRHPVQAFAHGFQLALRDVQRHGRDIRLGVGLEPFTALVEFYRLQLCYRRNTRDDLSAATRKKSVTLEFKCYFCAHACQQRQESPLQKIDRRRSLVVRTARNTNLTRAPRA